MSRQHFCPKNPDGSDWYDGTVAQCPHGHGQGGDNRTMRRAFIDRKAYRRADQQVHLGVDRGGYISGTDSGR